MAEVQKMRGEKIYECDFNITGVTDYGVTLDALLSAKEKVPLQGARIDVAFEGDIKGRITGKVRSGVEYLQLRADGRTDLDGRATIETEDGHRIAMRIEGVATPRANEPMMDLIANVRLTTACESVHAPVRTASRSRTAPGAGGLRSVLSWCRYG
jgi:Protein of unknown function (DUF3237)